MNLLQKFCLFLAFLTAIFIFYVSSLKTAPNPIPGFSYTPAVYHIVVFFLFSLFLFLSSRFEKEFIFSVLAISFVYASLDELHQFFVGREASFFDLGLDFFGSAMSLVVRIFLKLKY